VLGHEPVQGRSAYSAHVPPSPADDHAAAPARPPAAGRTLVLRLAGRADRLGDSLGRVRARLGRPTAGPRHGGGDAAAAAAWPATFSRPDRTEHLVTNVPPPVAAGAAAAVGFCLTVEVDGGKVGRAVP
jgi:hypothetical protein